MSQHPYGGPGIPDDPMDDRPWRAFVLGFLLGALIGAGVALVTALVAHVLGAWE